MLMLANQGLQGLPKLQRVGCSPSSKTALGEELQF